jgi:hypothetical protein
MHDLLLKQYGRGVTFFRKTVAFFRNRGGLSLCPSGPVRRRRQALHG